MARARARAAASGGLSLSWQGGKMLERTATLGWSLPKGLVNGSPEQQTCGSGAVRGFPPRARLLR